MEYRNKYNLRTISGVVSQAAFTHETTFSVHADLRAVSIVNVTLIDISTARLVVHCSVTLLALTTVAEANAETKMFKFNYLVKSSNVSMLIH